MRIGVLLRGGRLRSVHRVSGSSERHVYWQQFYMPCNVQYGFQFLKTWKNKNARCISHRLRVRCLLSTNGVSDLIFRRTWAVGLFPSREGWSSPSAASVLQPDRLPVEGVPGGVLRRGSRTKLREARLTSRQLLFPVRVDRADPCQNIKRRVHMTIRRKHRFSCGGREICVPIRYTRHVISCLRSSLEQEEQHANAAHEHEML